MQVSMPESSVYTSTGQQDGAAGWSSEKQTGLKKNVEEVKKKLN
jgi:hypothetical protein